MKSFLFGCEHECDFPPQANTIKATTEDIQKGSWLTIFFSPGFRDLPRTVNVKLQTASVECKKCGKFQYCKKYQDKEWKIASPSTKNLWKKTESIRIFTLLGLIVGGFGYVFGVGTYHGILKPIVKLYKD